MDPNLKDRTADENNKEIPGKIRVETGKEGGRDPGGFFSLDIGIGSKW